MTSNDNAPGVERSIKISERVARLILDDIVARQLTAGTMLPPEAAMLDRYKIGRASLREALRILEVHGLISVKPGPGGGPVVGEVTGRHFGRTSTFFYHAVGATLRELVEARTAMEPLMAGLAAKRLTPEAAERIRAIAQAGHDASEATPADWASATAAFHTVVGEAAGNKVLTLLSSSLVEIQNERLHPIFPVGNRDVVLDVHDRIAAAIIAGDAPEAERLMLRHTEHLSQNLEDLVPGLLNETIDWR
jgi:GntR family transcriptional repressor for pyruvate dehydrogenase complex